MRRFLETCDKLVAMGLAEQNPTFYTPEEYLKLERSAEIRHEYLDGEILENGGSRQTA